MASIQPSTFSPLTVSPFGDGFNLAVERHSFALRLVLGICVGGEQACEGECRREDMPSSAHVFLPFLN
jgi:hypothetical protein